MDIETQNPTEKPLIDILRDVSESALQLVTEQSQLIKAEFTATVREAGSDLRNLIVFGALTILAALPLMMFFIYGLGELLNGRYWLSSLIVAILWGGGAGWAAYRQYQQFLNKKPNFTATRKAFDRSAQTLKNSAKEVTNAFEQQTIR